MAAGVAVADTLGPVLACGLSASHAGWVRRGPVEFASIGRRIFTGRAPAGGSMVWSSTRCCRDFRPGGQ